MKRIIFNLKKVWYDKIASGEKTVEYREFNDYWIRRLCAQTDIQQGIVRAVLFKPFDEAVFRLGYSRKYPDIVRRIEKIDIGPCPYEGWDGEYFRIFFEKETSPK